MITLVNKFLPLDKIPEVNNFIYGLVYDDMDFFYKLLKTGVDDEGVKNYKYMIMKNYVKFLYSLLN